MGCRRCRPGLCTLPIAAMTLIFAPVSGRLVGSRGPRIGLLVGGGGIALGSALLTGPGRAHLDPLARARLPDLRHRLRHGQPADHQHRRARACRPRRPASPRPSRRPRASSARRSASPSSAPSPPPAPCRSAPGFVAASHAGWWIVTGCGVAVFALGLASTTERANASARAVAEELDDAQPGERARGAARRRLTRARRDGGQARRGAGSLVARRSADSPS